MGLIPLMAFLSRAAGAGWNKLRQWAEICFAAPFGYVAYASTGIWWVGLLGWLCSYLAMQTGHGRFYEMKGANLNDPKPEKIEWLAQRLYKGDITKPGYSWFCMGIKGFFIGLPAAPAGVLLAALWPLSYWLSFKYTKDSALAEWLAGAFAGLIILMAWSV